MAAVRAAIRNVKGVAELGKEVFLVRREACIIGIRRAFGADGRAPLREKSRKAIAAGKEDAESLDAKAWKLLHGAEGREPAFEGMGKGFEALHPDDARRALECVDGAEERVEVLAAAGAEARDGGFKALEELGGFRGEGGEDLVAHREASTRLRPLVLAR